MRKVLYSKWEILVMAMIVCSGFTSCGDDNNETSSSQSPAPSDTIALDLGLSVCWAQMNSPHYQQCHPDSQRLLSAVVSYRG